MYEAIRKIIAGTVLLAILIGCGGLLIGIGKIIADFIERPATFAVCFEHQPGLTFYATRAQMNGTGAYIFVFNAAGRERAFLRRNVKECGVKP